MKIFNIFNTRFSEDIYETSFWDDTVTTTVSEITKKLGFTPIRSNDDKTTREWDCVYISGTNIVPFTIYDWKEYREFSDDETITFHIGARNKKASFFAKNLVLAALDEDEDDDDIEKEIGLI